MITFSLVNSPTARLYGYVRPGDSWLEQDRLRDLRGRTNANMISHKLHDAAGEYRCGYDLRKGLVVEPGWVPKTT